MEIVQNPSELVRYFETALRAAPGQTVLIDRYLEGVEVEVDAVCDGEEVLIPGVMQHIERAGVHSGDSMAVYPALSLTETEIDTLVDYTRRIGRALGVRGLMNIQFVITGGGAYRGFSSNGKKSRFSPVSPNGQHSEVFILEVNPRSSRTIPFISKVTRVPMVRLAVEVMRGKTLREAAAEFGLEPGLAPRKKLVAVKAPVFSMSKLAGVDTFLGPEMKSTGEVMGIDRDFDGAIAKALIASGLDVKPQSKVLLSVADHDKADALGLVHMLAEGGYNIYATSGTAAMIRSLGINVTEVEKRLSGAGPTVVDIIEDGTVAAVVNTVTGDRQTLQDGFHIRRAAAERRIPCFTSLDTARCAVESLHGETPTYNVMSLGEYLEG
jgi:carbamoyl-phosphate synthase large subunit